MIIKLYLTFCILWQIAVLLLISGGIYVDIYSFLGISWHAKGVENFMGTVIGFLLLQLPALPGAILYVFTKRHYK